MTAFDPNIFMKGKRRKPTVCYPTPMPHEDVQLWGYHFDETNYFNIIGTSKPSSDMGGIEPTVIGHFYKEKPKEINPNELVGYYTGDSIEFTINNMLAELEPVKLKIDIFSRNTGILESDIMLNKGALIIGCGSVGSLVALELARAGVGRFFLIDMDILGYHNICRHQCGIQDVGKYKTTAVKERILQINPTAQVYTANKMIQEVDKSLLEQFCNKDAIMVGCADNREGDLYGNQHLAKPNGMPFISIGCWERAFAGEIFYCLPEGMPDYSDFVAALGDTSGRINANTHIYMGEVGSFEPGISADINFVTTIAVKMILDLLNRDNKNYTQRLIHNLTQYTLICNTNNPKIGGDMAEIFSYPLQVTTSIEVEYAHSQEMNTQE
jgi:molybdopterin/thiamine biosynthesis adenylyltransferase